jgi:hypothetical protein
MQKENLNGFPLKVLATETSGNARIDAKFVAKLEAKRIVRKSLKSSLFEVPKFYQKEENDAQMN